MDGSLRLRFSLALALVAARPLGGQVRPGIEVLISDSLHLVRGQRLGLLTDQTGVDRAGRRDVDLLRAAGQRVVALYSPEHGFGGGLDRARIPNSVDSATGLPIYSLYGGTHPPLDSLDAVVVDLQDVGARYYTFVATAAILLAEAARGGVPVIVLDRPNPLGGSVVQGNVQQRKGNLAALVSVLPVPMRHGLTLAELLRMANDVFAFHARLVVVPVLGWRRDLPYEATGLTWIPPSPGLPTLESVRHYPGLCLFEATNLSVGRGTASPFQLIGAPWLDVRAVLARLDAGARPGLDGVALSADTVTPHAPPDGKFDGQLLRVIRFRVSDPGRYDPTRAALATLAALVAVHPQSLRFAETRFDRLAGGPALRLALLGGDSPRVIWESWAPGLAAFERARLKYLLY